MSRTLITGSEQIAAGSITWDRMASGAIVPTVSLVDGSNFIKKDGSVTLTGSLNLGGYAATNGGTPASASDLTTKAYVDAKVSGFTLHGARTVSITNTASLSGLATIDGVTHVDGDVTLLTAQATASQNGPWVLHTGAWTRPTWWAAASTIGEGNYFIIEPDGTAYKNTKWWCTNTGTIVVDTTSVTFLQDQSGTQYSAGLGLTLAGTQFAVSPGNGITVGGGSVTAVGNATNLITVSASGIGITTGSSAQVIVGNSSGVPTWTSVSGDVTISNTGVTTVNHTSGSGFLKYGDFTPNETPSGAVNGSNTTFTLAGTPANSSLKLFMNGMLLEPGADNDYTVSANTITMLFAPITGDKLRAYYYR